MYLFVCVTFVCLRLCATQTAKQLYVLCPFFCYPCSLHIIVRMCMRVCKDCLYLYNSQRIAGIYGRWVKSGKITNQKF